MKIVIVDIETTGLNPQTSWIIEIGALILDTIKLEVVPDYFRVLIKRGQWIGEAKALVMNAKILEESEIHGVHEAEVLGKMRSWLHLNGLDQRSPDSSNEMGLGDYNSECPKIVGAGKNFASFDLQFLKQLRGYGWQVAFHHRAVDPAMFFIEQTDEVPPSLNECLKRAGLDKQTGHRAVDDCLLVAELLIAGFKRRKEFGY